MKSVSLSAFLKHKEIFAPYLPFYPSDLSQRYHGSPM